MMFIHKIALEDRKRSLLSIELTQRSHILRAGMMSDSAHCSFQSILLCTPVPIFRVLRLHRYDTPGY